MNGDLQASLGLAHSGRRAEMHFRLDGQLVLGRLFVDLDIMFGRPLDAVIAEALRPTRIMPMPSSNSCVVPLRGPSRCLTRALRRQGKDIVLNFRKTWLPQGLDPARRCPIGRIDRQ
jgi:hypothetical protein